MKPAKFEYRAPRELEEALSILAEVGDEGKVLAGGQSLVPSMNFRLARPAVLVDINGIGGIDSVTSSSDHLVIGTLARHVRFERPVTDGPLGHLLALAARKVGHRPIRIRGTFGGSLAHADPAAEWCMIATLLDATMVASSVRGQREITASNFFKTVFSTALEPDELLTEARLPLLNPAAKIGFVEFSRRAGDFAIVAASSVLDVEGGRISTARIALGSVGGTPLRSPAAEAVLQGNVPSGELFAEAGEAAAGDVEPMGDIHGSPEYRRDLVRVLTRRSLQASTEH
ncbi:MAG: xanthine dehydrogenase family protein subunit M [Actinobacteria bacterium]|nr:xanthine dehydrogenase family protein subunit M [Actinomycetota bacterium]